MENLTWNDIYNAGRDFLYNYTELAIWLGIGFLIFILFWLLAYSFEARRMFVIVMLLLVGLSYALYYFGVYFVPDDYIAR